MCVVFIRQNVMRLAEQTAFVARLAHSAMPFPLLVLKFSRS